MVALIQCSTTPVWGWVGRSPCVRSVRLPPTKTLGITARLYSLMALAIVAVAALAASSIHFARMTSHAATTLSRSGLAGVSRATELELLIEKHKSLVEAAAKERDAARLGFLYQSVRAIGSDLKSLAAKLESGEYASQSFAILPELTAKADLVLELAASNLPDRAQTAVASYLVTSTEINDHIRQERAEHLTVASGNLALLRDNARSLIRWVLGTTLAALFIIGPVSLALMRRVTLRLRDITRGMLRLAANDTTVVIHGTSEPDEIGSMARALKVFKANAISLLEHQSKLESVNLWLDIAMNHMSRGLSMFDANGRLILSNANYARIYDLPAHLTQQGTPFAAIVAHRVERGIIIEAPSSLEAQSEPPTFEQIIASPVESTFVQRTEAGRRSSTSANDSSGLHVSRGPSKLSG